MTNARQAKMHHVSPEKIRRAKLKLLQPLKLVRPQVVAIATHTLPQVASFPDPVNLPGVAPPRYGQDITFGYNRPAPGQQSVGDSPETLIPKMRRLLNIFAAGDKSGMATRLFNAFLAKRGGVTYFDDHALNAAVANHPNAQGFCRLALNAPNRTGGVNPTRRIHQALKNAKWDIRNILTPTDLGTPAFNLGAKERRDQDWGNGLALMINGVQHVYVVATHYHHDQAANRYSIRLKYIFYDVFGLDDEDLRKYGAESDSRLSSNIAIIAAPIGITAWWQLQHQHGYAPLVTRSIVEKSYHDILAK
ncbi:MAG: hypothetical protein FWH15_02595 [Betaproteobacteria bacterium]|nr:hypothetical protein [Betaproteobacteria bacterium]